MELNPNALIVILDGPFMTEIDKQKASPFCYLWFIFVVKLEEGSRTEQMQAQKCRARIAHLESADAENLAEWNSTRLKRILVDYMLRMSYFDTAVKLSESSNIQVCTLAQI